MNKIDIDKIATMVSEGVKPTMPEGSKSMTKILQEAYDISAHFTHGEDPDVLVVHGVKFVKVINCKDCKHWREFMAGLGVCDKLKTDMDGSSYCNHGEQSENELDFLDEESEHEIEREIKALRKGEE